MVGRLVISTNPHYDPENTPTDNRGRSKVSTRQWVRHGNRLRKDLHGCVWGGWEVRPDSSICSDESLSLYIKLHPFENNGGRGGVLNGVWAMMILHAALQRGVVLQDACRPSFRTPPWGSASACLEHVLAQHSVPQWSSRNWDRNTFFLQDELGRAGLLTRSKQTKHMVHIFLQSYVYICSFTVLTAMSSTM